MTSTTRNSKNPRRRDDGPRNRTPPRDRSRRRGADTAPPSYGSSRDNLQHTIVPQLSLGKLSTQTVEAFRSGNWRSSYQPLHEPPTATHFSAFSLLSLLPVGSDSPLLPAAGVLFTNGIKVLDSLLWLLTLGVSSSSGSRTSTQSHKHNGRHIRHSSPQSLA